MTYLKKKNITVRVASLMKEEYLFEECPDVNIILHQMKELSASQYKEAIKLIGDVDQTRMSRGRSKNGNRCR